MASEMTVAEIAVRFMAGLMSNPKPDDWIFAKMNPTETAITSAEFFHAELVKRGHIKAGVPVLDGSTAPCVEQFTLPWRGMPEWAQWAAMDENRGWAIFEGKPVAGESAWIPGDDDRWIQVFGMKRFPGDWRDSLQRRPASRTIKFRFTA